MSVIKVYGASDDLIEVDGDISEEWGHYDAGVSYLACSDGTLLSIEYTESGVWRVLPVARGSATLAIAQCPEDDDANYTDVATLDGDVAWVALASEVARRG